MTGFGAQTHQCEDATFTVEVRTVNNRYLKVVTKLPDSCASLEGQVERLVRTRVGRGTVHVVGQVQSVQTSVQVSIDEDVVAALAGQAKSVADRQGLPAEVSLDTLLALPGVIRDERQRVTDPEILWAGLESALVGALDQLQGFRREEGTTIEADLNRQCRVISEQMAEIRGRAPVVVEAYREKLVERVNKALAPSTITEADVIREVSIFADRCDINEEISRMDAHLNQFQSILDGETSEGRKLEFLGQEMVRETNTIGSKANDVEIAHRVVDIKLAIDRIRENLQNVE